MSVLVAEINLKFHDQSDRLVFYPKDGKWRVGACWEDFVGIGCDDDLGKAAGKALLVWMLGETL